MADFATVEQAIEEIKNGRMIVVVDDEDRENEGDLIVAAATVTPEVINFMAKENVEHSLNLLNFESAYNKAKDIFHF